MNIAYTITSFLNTKAKRSLIYTTLMYIHNTYVYTQHLCFNSIYLLGNDPATGSPIAALLRLISYLVAQAQLPSFHLAISPIHPS